MLGSSESSSLRQRSDWPSHGLIGDLDESIDLPGQTGSSNEDTPSHPSTDPVPSP